MMMFVNTELKNFQQHEKIIQVSLDKTYLSLCYKCLTINLLIVKAISISGSRLIEREKTIS